MVFQISLFRVIFTDFWLLKKLLNGKTSSVLSKTLSLDIAKPYNLFISENIWKFY